MSEFGEPWTVSEFGRYLGGRNWSVLRQTPTNAPLLVAECNGREMAERIVACVSACEGIPTEELPGWHDAPTRPGKWLCWVGDSPMFAHVDDIVESSIGRFPKTHRGWYGPIPR